MKLTPILVYFTTRKKNIVLVSVLHSRDGDAPRTVFFVVVARARAGVDFPNLIEIYTVRPTLSFCCYSKKQTHVKPRVVAGDISEA